MSQTNESVHQLLVVHHENTSRLVSLNDTTTSTLKTSSPRIGGLKIGISGIRKKYLFISLISLCWLVIINILLTFWISRAVRFSFRGIGPLTVLEKSFRSDNTVNFLNNLAVGSIHSRLENPISLQSIANITLAAQGRSFSPETSYITIGATRFDVFADSFSIHDPDGKQIFRATGDLSTISAHTLKIKGAGGIHVDGAVQSPILKNRERIRLESSTRELQISGPQRVSVSSSKGRVSLESHGNLTLKSVRGKIVFSGESMYMQNILSPVPSKSGKPYGGIYQLCFCKSGNVFLASPTAKCRTDARACNSNHVTQ